MNAKRRSMEYWDTYLPEPISGQQVENEEEDENEDDPGDELVMLGDSSSEDDVPPRPRIPRLQVKKPERHCQEDDARRMKKKRKKDKNNLGEPSEKRKKDDDLPFGRSNAAGRKKPKPTPSHRRTHKPVPFSEANPRPVDMVSNHMRLYSFYTIPKHTYKGERIIPL